MSTDAGWYPDPRGRHEHRYWDGQQWTDHVSDGGQTSTDPVDATSASSATQSSGSQPAAETTPASTSGSTPPAGDGGHPPPQASQGASQQATPAQQQATPAQQQAAPAQQQAAPAQQQWQGQPQTSAKTNGMAVASLVVSLLLGWVPILGGIGAIILGFIGRKQIKESGGLETGSGLAMAGIIIGVISILGWIAIFVFVGSTWFTWLTFWEDLEREIERQSDLGIIVFQLLG